MSSQFSRTRMQFGDDAMARLAGAKVALFGVGGVGGHCAESLARGGVGTLHLIDPDTVALSNLNRQLAALHSTLGQKKVDVMRARILDINPACHVEVFPLFYLPETADAIDLAQYDYVIDAIDTVSAKLALAARCHALGVPLISCMGTANKLDPTLLRVGDIFQTSGCPLARVMRRELRKRGVPALKVVYSPEEALTPLPPEAGDDCSKRQTPSSNSFVPATAGILLAATVIKALAGIS